ncbi:hypothetical protein [Chondromyces crocatus]|uniref:Disintegrin domain-containing protein n=1 Tax=Chondromyces crocatus TaxID=52 RepID=A0A0K1EEB6_CHOCO|nr:hypothetical protein [Chondromyces crocatus]AKT39032.1 uncharacterized protein CMC5_031780 [Chondromyces crocatus]
MRHDGWKQAWLAMLAGAALQISSTVLQGCVLDNQGTCDDQGRCVGKSGRPGGEAGPDFGTPSNPSGGSAQQPTSELPGQRPQGLCSSSCDDGNPCTDDTCDDAHQCHHDPAIDGTPAGVGGCLVMTCQSGIARPAEPLEPLPAGVSCGEDKRCDGAGHCKLALGGSCDDDAACASGHCVAGVCCGLACDGLCLRCDPADFDQCQPLAFGEHDPMCSEASACNDAGECKLVDGTGCISDGQCLSGHCTALGEPNSPFRCAPVP